MDGEVSTGTSTRAVATTDQPNALEKVVSVLESLATERKLSRISQQTGLATSTVHRILQDLVRSGWAEEDEDHGYMLGSRLLALAAQAETSSFLARKAAKYLRQLRDATGDTVHLATRRGDEMLYVAKLDGRKAYQMRSHVGLTVPLHCTAVGKALLACSSESEVRATVARAGLPARTEHTVADVDDLLDRLQAVRTRGFAVDDQENEINIRCVGAAILGPRGTPVACVSVSSLTYDLEGARVGALGQLVTKTAQAISGALGGPVSDLKPPAAPSGPQPPAASDGPD